jgi:hypothetical protein
MNSGGRKWYSFLLTFTLLVAVQFTVKGQTDTVLVEPVPAVVIPDADASLLDDDTTAVTRRRPNPRKALILSAVLPGAGQFYNRRYWKIPVIYIGAGVLGYFIQDNYGRYVIFRDAFIAKQKYDQFILTEYYPELDESNSRVNNLEFMRRYRNQYRRWFEQSIILAAALYALNIVDANVDAHLRGFQLGNKNLSLLPAMPADAPGGGLTLRLSLK